MSVGADLKLPFWFAFFPAVYTIYLDLYCESSSIHNYSIYQVFVMCRKLKLSVARSTVLVTLIRRDKNNIMGYQRTKITLCFLAKLFVLANGLF